MNKNDLDRAQVYIDRTKRILAERVTIWFDVFEPGSTVRLTCIKAPWLLRWVDL